MREPAGPGAATTTPSAETKEKKATELGNFSVSLTVKDIKAFYETLDFEEFGGKFEENWIVLQNGNARIGPFQGMFDKNIMTFLVDQHVPSPKR